MAAAKDLSTAFAEALVLVGRADARVVVLDADIADSCATERFRSAFPDRAFDLGVAEQSLPTIAAGLALAGKIPICNSFAVFAVERGLDMIRQSIAYNGANVKIVGHCAGQSMGYVGPSHHTLEDISALRAIPRMVILSPSDATQLGQMVEAMVQHSGPVYLRLARAAVPDVHDPLYRFRIGETCCLRDGADVSLFFTGDLASLAILAAEELELKGIGVQVVDVPTLKPLSADDVLRHGVRTSAAVTVEDHNVIGGLGSAIAEVYAERLAKPVVRVGIDDKFTESDEGTKLREAYGISVAGIEEAVRRALGLRRDLHG